MSLAIIYLALDLRVRAIKIGRTIDFEQRRYFYQRQLGWLPCFPAKVLTEHRGSLEIEAELIHRLKSGNYELIHGEFYLAPTQVGLDLVNEATIIALRGELGL